MTSRCALRPDCRCRVVLPRRGLVAQAELQTAVAGLESGIVQRALQLRRILTQHRQRFRLFDRQVRSHLAVAIDVDANIDAAEICRIETDLEMALAALAEAAISTASPLKGTGALVAAVTPNDPAEGTADGATGICGCKGPAACVPGSNRPAPA